MNIPLYILSSFAVCFKLSANPFPDPLQVPVDVTGEQRSHSAISGPLAHAKVYGAAKTILRVDVEWLQQEDRFVLAQVLLEKSGTEALLRRAPRKDLHGSYQGVLIDRATGQEKYFDAVGTGQEFRKLTRALSFRFPYEEGEAQDFKLIGEDPVKGEMNEILRVELDVPIPKRNSMTPEVYLLAQATEDQGLVFNIYAEGFTYSRKERFLVQAQKVVDVLKAQGLPFFNALTLQAVFKPSAKRLGRAQDLGMPVAVRDSYLGLYFPYWNDFGRWYHVVYPTSEFKYRDAIGEVPYDYALALVDDNQYWGVGNFKELTAVPVDHASFTYLLLHELGHYFGLNEEYSQGGKTELAFAPEIAEPWSQNITFQREKYAIKWHPFMQDGLPIPTPSKLFRNNTVGPWGVYTGGYAQTDPSGRSAVPGLACNMNTGERWCPICRAAIAERIKFDRAVED